MSEQTGFVSAESEGFTVSSNTESAEGLADNLASDAPDEVSEAASKLGKKGGKASAESRSARGVDEGSGTQSGGGLGEAEDAEEASATPEKPLGKPRDDPKARMLEATRKEAEAKREAKALKEENERLKRQFESYRPPQQEQPAPTKDPNAAPDKADFDDYEAYIDARAEWKARQEWAKQRQETERNTWVEAQAKRMAETVDSDMSNFTGKMREADPEVVAGLPPEMMDALVPTWNLEPGQPVTQRNVMADEIMKLENPVKVLQHLSDIQEFQRIATLQSAPAITRALARLDARFEAATAAVSPKPKVSAAKPPVRAVAGSPGQAEVDENDMSFEAFVAHDRKRASR